ncbi:MAG: hypothetical protein E6K70_09000 [Planctomycetota bacterium]|nr:MAG: hypothetical protein E6K70_09000 [Planctomycetota bacterium]
MCKKIFIATVAVVAGLFILHSTHLGSYARTALKKVKSAAQGQVPLEFRLETARNEAAQLIPDMRRNISAVATKDVAVSRLRDEVKDMQAKLEQKKDHVRAMAGELKSGNEKVVYNGREMSSRQLTDRLSRELEVSQVIAKQLGAKEKLLDAEEKALEAAKERLANMQNVKAQIDNEISLLEAQVQELRLVQDRSKIPFDDSRLSHIKSLLDDVRTAIKVDQKTIEYVQAYGDFDGPASSKPKTRAQLIKEAEELAGESENGKVAQGK